ncbi:molecular chaperone HtpG [Aquisalimonas asiatica]|uniref:Chaperone protein HtpG n=1 Tax=Aquisalimonas asiatica TaxID=406100 RepID=A0A1H8VPY5_9GAMM|nr:molecular chaperone HtpG [Aquisalimonas asiatica]SEP17465.1 molecular chaperone HtpG [Aquisalimonas asiatica]
MSVAAQKETLEFQTEVRQLLHLMVHSLYSSREIFLRELISNASDACDRLRFDALKDESLYEGDGELGIRVEYDKEARTVTISDNGIGMNRDDVIENLGTIARSGTQHFINQLTGDQAKDAKLIGQFGVGFYSSFIVAQRVEVLSRRAGVPASEGVRWESDGEGAYTLETVELPRRGTQVILHLRDDMDEFLDGYRLRQVIRTYSDHISLPIVMPKEATGEEDEAPGDETVNKASALWMRSKTEISDDEYEAFYKQVAHDFEGPLTWMHNKVEGNLSYVSLLFIPKRAPFDLFNREQPNGVHLYVRRVFIMDDAEHLMPRYLRFVRGIIDSDDLPLNVSRELLQHNRQIEKIKSASVKRVLDRLESMAEKEPENYASFWSTFGRVLKEGPAEDFGNRERIAKLLRFSSTHTDSETENVSLDDYIARMKENQTSIYYVTADSFSAAKNSPHLEIFRKKGIEVLLLGDPVDEWCVTHLGEYNGKQLVHVAKGDLDLGDLDDAEDKEEREKTETEYKPLVERLEGVLGDRVKNVRVSHRLTDSPSCLVVEEHEFAVSMQRMLKAAGHTVPAGKPVMEINPEHALIQRLQGVSDDGTFDEWAHVLFDQAMLTEGGQLDDPAAFVRRMNRLLAES